MFKPRVAAIVLALLTFTGCDGGTPEAANVTKIAQPNVYQQRLLTLNETDRNLTLRRAIQDDGGQCPKIVGAAYQQEHQGMAMWAVRCSNEDWAVYVGAGGTVQARLCAQAQQLGLPICSAVPKD